MAVKERIEVKPAIIHWMFERTGKHPDQEGAPAWTREAARWLKGGKPTPEQLLNTTRSAHIAYYHLLEDEPPPKAVVPLPDMRTTDNCEIIKPSLELLEAVHLCEWRQEWYRENLLELTDYSCDLVGSASLQDSPESVANKMRDLLKLPLIPEAGSWEDRLQQLAEAAELANVLVMRAMMMENRHRMLNPKEFRGFALADDVAPVIFINLADNQGIQAFAFAHEFAHLMLGKTALSGSPRPTEETHDEEQWCSAVATEFLVPTRDFQKEYNETNDPLKEARRLSRRYRVSTLVTLIRQKTLGLISNTQFQAAYDAEKASMAARLKANSEHDQSWVRFCQLNAASPLVCRAVIYSVRAQKMTERTACKMLGLGFGNSQSLSELGELLGIEGQL